MNKTLNLVIMLLMAALAIRQVYSMTQHGVNATNVIFGLLFAAFAVRRFMIHQKLSS